MHKGLVCAACCTQCSQQVLGTHLFSGDRGLFVFIAALVMGRSAGHCQTGVPCTSDPAAAVGHTSCPTKTTAHGCQWVGQRGRWWLLPSGPLLVSCGAALAGRCLCGMGVMDEQCLMKWQQCPCHTHTCACRQLPRRQTSRLCAGWAMLCTPFPMVCLACGSWACVCDSAHRARQVASSACCVIVSAWPCALCGALARARGWGPASWLQPKPVTRGMLFDPWQPCSSRSGVGDRCT
jgi:hypothetical protein